MADEKRATDKIYTHAASRKARGEKPAAKKPSAESEGSEPKEAAGAGDSEGSAKPSLAEVLKEIRDRHKTEHADAHGGHSSALDKMYARHAEEIDAAIAKHGTHLEASADTTSREA